MSAGSFLYRNIIKDSIKAVEKAVNAGSALILSFLLF